MRAEVDQLIQWSRAPSYEGRRAKTDGAQPAVVAADQVAQLRSHQRRIAAGMLLDNQIVPQSMQRIGVTAQQIQVQALHLVHPLGHLGQGGQRGAGTRSRWVRARFLAGVAGNRSRCWSFRRATLALDTEGRPSGAYQPSSRQTRRAKSLLLSSGSAC